MLLENINPRYSTQLYGLDIEFDKLSNLLLNENLPNVIVLTGEKGIGKFTLINHLVISYFDKENYEIRGWTTTDIYQNRVETKLFNIEVNMMIDEKLFRIQKYIN